LDTSLHADMTGLNEDAADTVDALNTDEAGESL
jgi:hypothetical protein